jgi:aspartyl-tRNA(Asn)/glutamyl-tRNA(Gln) amidotransferase subunit B
MMSSMMGILNARNLPLETERNTPTANAAILSLSSNGEISGGQAKQLLEFVLDTGDPIGVIVEREGLKQNSDTGAIDAVIAEILSANADKVGQYKGGKEALFGFFVGQTMKAMGGKANPQVVNELLKKALA